MNTECGEKLSQQEEIDTSRRRFLVTAATTLTGVGAVFAAVPFASSWWPTAKAQAASGPVEVNVGHLEFGQQLTVEWRGKPVWIIRRSKDVVENLSHHDNLLRDPESRVDQQPEYARNIYRALNPEYLVLVGICTHLGCSPKYRPNLGDLSANWPGGFYCPCHGSTFDLSGRVFKGVPAPINLQVPPYAFINDHTIIVGVDAKVGNAA